MPGPLIAVRTDVPGPGGASTRRYHRDGFLVVRGLLQGAALARFLREVEELLAVPDNGSVPLWKFYEEDEHGEEGPLVRVEKFCHSLPYWRRVALESELHRRASALLGEEAELFKEKLIVKPPGGDAIGPHQEMHTDWSDYGDAFLVAAIAIDACTPANGCLEVTAGDHRRGLIGNRGTTITGRARLRLRFRKIRMRPGDCLFFDAWTPHQSGPNLTDEPRRILFLAYNRRSAGDHYERYFSTKASEYWPRARVSAAQKVRVVRIPSG